MAPEPPKLVADEEVAAFWVQVRALIEAEKGIKVNYQPRVRELIQKFGFTREQVAYVAKLGSNPISGAAPGESLPETANGPSSEKPPPEEKSAVSPGIWWVENENANRTSTDALPEPSVVDDEKTPSSTTADSQHPPGAVVEEKPKSTVEPVVEEKPAAASRRRWVLAAACFVTVSGVGVYWGIGYLLLGSLTPRAAEVAATGKPTFPFPTAGEDQVKLPDPGTKAPAWGGPALAAAIDQARTVFPGQPALFEFLGSANQPDRARAYQQLLALALHCGVKPGGNDPVALLLSKSWAWDPDHANAQGILHDLLQLLPDADALPERDDAYNRAFWALGVALDGLNHNPVASSRSEALGQALDQALGIRLDRGLAADKVGQRCLSELGLRSYRAVIKAAATNPVKALDRRNALSLRTRDHLQADVQDKLDTDFLLTALPAAGDAWVRFDPLLRSCVHARDPAGVLRIVDFYEKVPDRTLQVRIGQLLAERVKLSPDLPPAELAAGVRKGIVGITGPEPAGPIEGRAALFRDRAKEALARLDAPPDKPDELLRETLRLAHLSRLGCALLNKTLGPARFDGLKDKPPVLAVEAKPKPMPGQPAVKPRLGQLNDDLINANIRVLLFGTSVDRPNALRVLGSLPADTQLSPRQGEAIAWYLLVCQKDRQELATMFPNLGSVPGSRAVQLAVADLVLTTVPNQALVERFVTQMTGNEVKLGADPAWRTRCFRLILKHVLEQMEPSELFDKACDLLRDIYRDHAALLGLETPELATAASPAQVLETVIPRLAGRLQKEGPIQSRRQYLERYPHDLAVAAYLARNDVQRTVLLQRIWANLLAVHVAQQKPQKAVSAAAVCQQLAAADRQANHVLVQLRAGEEHILRLWLLMHD